MGRDEVLALLRAHKVTLAQRFVVADLALFGSFARDRSGDDSDVDLPVCFDGPGRPGDLVTHGALRQELRPYVEREAIHV